MVAAMPIAGTFVDGVWQVVGLGAMALVVVAFLVDGWLASLLKPEVVREMSDPLYQGQEFEASLGVTNPSSRTVRFEVIEVLSRGIAREAHTGTLVVQPQSMNGLRYEGVPTQRGHHELCAPTLRWAGPLGLANCTREIGESTMARVFPRMRQPREASLYLERLMTQSVGTVRERFRGASQELYGLRAYQPGDGLRRIDWKATARLGKPITKEYALAQNQRVVLGIDCSRAMAAEVAGVTPFDEALSSAIALLRAAVSQGDDVTVVIYDQTIRRVIRVDRRTRSFAALFEEVYQLQPTDTQANPRLLAAWVARHIKRRSLIFCMSSAVNTSAGKQLAEVMRGMSRRHVPIWVNLSDPTLQEVASGWPESTKAVFGMVAAQEVLATNTRAFHSLRGSGVQVLDTPASTLTLGLLQHYVDLKMDRI